MSAIEVSAEIPPAELPLGDGLEAGPLEVVSPPAPLGSGPLGE